MRIIPRIEREVGNWGEVGDLVGYRSYPGAVLVPAESVSRNLLDLNRLKCHDVGSK